MSYLLSVLDGFRRVVWVSEIYEGQQTIADMCFHCHCDHDKWVDQGIVMILVDFGPLREGLLVVIGRVWET